MKKIPKNPDLKEKVKWFLNNLDMQLEDLEYQEQGVQVEVYFDTAEVRDALLGLHGFYKLGGRVDTEKFSESRTLVICLAAAGWLGQLQLLPPHQAEFLSFLSSGLYQNSDITSSNHSPEGFLHAVGVKEIVKQVASLQKNAHKEQIVKILQQHAGSARTLFKAMQCVSSGGYWKPRLVAWRDEKRLKIIDGKYDYASVVRSAEFEALKKELDIRRPNVTKNNFADAVALSILISLVGEFKTDRKAIPRFFVSTDLLADVIADSEMASLFSYKNRAGTISSALRGADYFMFRGTFRPPHEARSGGKYEPSFFNTKELRLLRDEVEEITNAQKDLTTDAINKIKVNVFGKPLGEVIDALWNVSFVEAVWLPFVIQEEVTSTIQALEEATRLAKDEDFQEKVEEAIKATKNELEATVRDYNIVSSLWHDLEASTRGFQNHHYKDPAREFEVFRDLGLLRFSFPDDTHDRIQGYIHELLSNDEDLERDRRIVLINDYVAGLTQGKAEIQVGDIIVTAAVLWILRLDEKLIALSNRIEEFPHYSFDLVSAAAIFRLNRKKYIQKGRDLLKKCQILHDANKDPNLAVGIAYLFFHLATSLGFRPLWTEDSDPNQRAKDDEGSQLIEKSISYAKEAYSMLGAETARMKKVYALNQYLYYLVEGGRSDQLASMHQAAISLANFTREAELWQRRFDDTLGWYYYRLSRESADKNKQISYLETAKRHIEIAHRADPVNEVVRYHLTLVDATRASLGQ